VSDGPEPGWGGEGPEFYEDVGRGYARTRHQDPRLAAAIHAALGDARSVVNVGAGAGSYEPADRRVVAVEPSAVMRAQRPPGAAPVVDAVAEDLPFADDAFDAAMAVLSDHHWKDQPRGLAELRRVARHTVVLFSWDPAHVLDSWLVRDYIPAFARLIPPGYELAQTVRTLGGDAEIIPVPIPHDCTDGFLHAYWRRPEAYLDPEVRAGISVFARLRPAEFEPGLERLTRDLDDGTWQDRNAALRELDALDLGYRLVVARYGRARTNR
jgi:SAM-dependent methyltransferase